MNLKTLSFIFIVTIGLTLYGASSLFLNRIESGYLTIKIKDPPDDWGPASAVYITSSEISIHRVDVADESGWFETGISIANLSLEEFTVFGRVIGHVSLKAGTYNIIRFEIVQAIVTVQGKNYSCEVPSGKFDTQIVPGGVTVTQNHFSTLLVDIRPKIIQNYNTFKLLPTVRASPI